MTETSEMRCPICHRMLRFGELRCCPVQAPPNPEAHGARCRRAEMKLTPIDAFDDPMGYGLRFQAGWLAEDVRIGRAR